MSVTVTVQDDGTLILEQDGQTFPPVTVEAAQALADRIPDAQNAAARTSVTTAVRALTDILKPSDDAMSVQATITSTAVTATVDADTYARIAAALVVAPGVDGALRQGPVTVFLAD